LWEQIPAELRLDEFTPRTLGDHPAFRWRLEGHPRWQGFDLYSLPVPMQRDFAYCVWRVIEQGLRINCAYSQLVWWLIMLGEDRRVAGGAPLRSLIDLALTDWERELIKARARRTGKLRWTSSGPGTLRRCYRHLAVAYDPREWWRHDIWSPKFDPRIPLRDHEPSRPHAGYDFLAIEQRWLREGLKWHLKVALETGLLRWATLRSRLFSLT